MNCHLDFADLKEYMGKVFGTSNVVEKVTRMHGGAQKRIGDMLVGMHANERSIYGKVDQSETNSEKCYQLQIINAKVNLDYACGYIRTIDDSRRKLLDKLYPYYMRIGSLSGNNCEGFGIQKYFSEYYDII